MRVALAFVLATGCTTVKPEPSPPKPVVSPSPSPPSSAASAAPPALLPVEREVTMRDLKSLKIAVEVWKLNHPGDHCPSLKELESEKSLKPDQNVIDLWGTRYEVVCGDEEAGAASAGPDRTWRTADDLWYGSKLPGKLPVQ